MLDQEKLKYAFNVAVPMEDLDIQRIIDLQQKFVGKRVRVNYPAPTTHNKANIVIPAGTEGKCSQLKKNWHGITVCIIDLPEEIEKQRHVGVFIDFQYVDLIEFEGPDIKQEPVLQPPVRKQATMGDVTEYLKLGREDAIRNTINIKGNSKFYSGYLAAIDAMTNWLQNYGRNDFEIEMKDYQQAIKDAQLSAKN